MKKKRWPHLLRLRLRSLFRRGQVARELQKELSFHVEQEIEEGRARGLSPEEARWAALKRMGGMTQIQEECRDMRGTNLLESLGQDLRYAGRGLGKSRGFTLAMVLTLALSIGATTAILSILEGVLLPPLTGRIEKLAGNPRPSGCKKLRGGVNEWRIRIGDYRVIYIVDDAKKTIDITRIAHRKEVHEP